MSFGLKQLSPNDRAALIAELWASQNGSCYISGLPIDLQLHANAIDVDHVIPTRDGGKDDKSNWALTLSHYNRSKQASDLRIARVLARYEALKGAVADARGVNLGHLLADAGGGRHALAFVVDSHPGMLRYSLAATGDAAVVTLPLWTDPLSKLRYVFAMLPIEYVFHDDRLNPRGIGNNIRGLVEEFHKGFPQLHVPLAWIDTAEPGGSRVRVFDGQHKAAAQVLLNVRTLPVRIFVDPDTDLLLTANTHAGTTLRQVAFDKATQRHLGASILRDRIDRFRTSADWRRITPATPSNSWLTTSRVSRRRCVGMCSTRNATRSPIITTIGCATSLKWAVRGKTGRSPTAPWRRRSIPR